MKLLLDENISLKIVKYLQNDFPESNHIDFLNMQGLPDIKNWDYAKKEGFTIISKDNDFRQRSFLFGHPPKVIWLSVGNSGTKKIKDLIIDNINPIKQFLDSTQEGLLVLKPIN